MKTYAIKIAAPGPGAQLLRIEYQHSSADGDPWEAAFAKYPALRSIGVRPIHHRDGWVRRVLPAAR